MRVTRLDRLLHNAHVVVMGGDTYRNPPPAKKARRGEQRERPIGGW